MRRAYLLGCKTAAEKYALASEAWKDIAELAGLGLLAAPGIHNLATQEKKDPKDMVETGGLGVLAVPSIANLLMRKR